MKTDPEDGSMAPTPADKTESGQPKPPEIDFSALSPKIAEKLRAGLAEAAANRDPYGMDSEELSDMNRMLRGEAD